MVSVCVGLVSAVAAMQELSASEQIFGILEQRRSSLPWYVYNTTKQRQPSTRGKFVSLEARLAQPKLVLSDGNDIKTHLNHLCNCIAYCASTV